MEKECVVPLAPPMTGDERDQFEKLVARIDEEEAETEVGQFGHIRLRRSTFCLTPD